MSSEKFKVPAALILLAMGAGGVFTIISYGHSAFASKEATKQRFDQIEKTAKERYDSIDKKLDQLLKFHLN